jgi:hypothetical protein
MTTAGKSGSGGLGSGGRSGTGGSGLGGKSGGTGGGAAVAFSQVATIIGKTCGTCHAASMPVLKNDMNLRTTLTTFKAMPCANNPLVTPNDPSKSAIVQLVSKQCGATVMPVGCKSTPCIPQADLTTITNWINAGAPP